jgi:release factor glutamine methyltransferase
MNIGQWLARTTKQLKEKGISTPRLDALVLLGDELNKNSAQLLASPDLELSNEQQQRLELLVKRRKQHEPLAYIRGKCEFYGREFYVNRDVLVPRPETETMIEMLKSLPSSAQKSVVDVGTGSGAIAITVACELSDVAVLATDIDANCLKVARQNCSKHQLAIDLVRANLLEAVKIPHAATILANLPYVPDEYTINESALKEPKLAIFGGQDGLDLYRQLFKQLGGHHGYVLTESLPFQHGSLAQIAQGAGYRLEATDDFIQLFKSGEQRQA